jgi:hypothetical protein
MNNHTFKGSTKKPRVSLTHEAGDNWDGIGKFKRRKTQLMIQLVFNSGTFRRDLDSFNYPAFYPV